MSMQSLNDIKLNSILYTWDSYSQGVSLDTKKGRY